jgi:hypothetical protein
MLKRHSGSRGADAIQLAVFGGGKELLAALLTSLPVPFSITHGWRRGEKTSNDAWRKSIANLRSRILAK